MAKLDKLGGTSLMKNATEDALKASKDYVNPQIEAAISTGNLPARGKYSKGRLKQSLDRDNTVEWSGMTSEIKVGFDFSKSGVESIFLMYGTPRMKPVKGLKNAIYGTKTQREIGEIQADEINKIIKRTMGG